MMQIPKMMSVFNESIMIMQNIASNDNCNLFDILILMMSVSIDD